MTEKPSLLAVTSSGEQWEDPSEDLLYMLLQDLVDGGGGSLRVDLAAGQTMEVSLAGDVFRVRRHDGPAAAPLVATSGELREVHAACTRWAFDLDDAAAATALWGGFDGTLPWQTEPGSTHGGH